MNQQQSTPAVNSDTANNLEADLEILARGTDSIFSREELKLKLQKSQSDQKPLRVKLGLDPTAPDIHLGFAVVLRKLRAFQDLGHEAHLIIGDFTAQIGDPTGKSKTRPQLTRAQVEANAETYKQQLFRILDESKTTIHFNGDWLGKMGFAEVIQLAAKYTSRRLWNAKIFPKDWPNTSHWAYTKFCIRCVRAGIPCRFKVMSNWAEPISDSTIWSGANCSAKAGRNRKS